MRKYFSFILVLTIIFVSSVFSMRADILSIDKYIPCEKWWPTEPYSDSYQYYLTVDNCDCEFIVGYYRRENDKGIKELQIVGIVEIRTDPSGCCPSLEEAERLAHIAIWNNDPFFNNQDIEYAAQQYPCWEKVYPDLSDPINTLDKIKFRTEDIVLAPGDIFLPHQYNGYEVQSDGSVLLPIFRKFIPCTGMACCYWEYDCEYDADGNITKLEERYPGSPSDSQDSCDQASSCEPHCHKMKWNWDINQGFYKNAGINFDDFNDISLLPNPSDGYLTIRINSSRESKIMIEVLNLAGITIYRKQVEINSTMLEHNLDLNDLANGSYIIKCNFGTEIISKKFIIKK